MDDKVGMRSMGLDGEGVESFNFEVGFPIIDLLIFDNLGHLIRIRLQFGHFFQLLDVPAYQELLQFVLFFLLGDGLLQPLQLLRLEFQKLTVQLVFSPQLLDFLRV